MLNCFEFKSVVYCWYDVEFVEYYWIMDYYAMFMVMS